MLFVTECAWKGSCVMGAAHAWIFSFHPPVRDPFPDSIEPWASHTPASTGLHPQPSQPFVSRQGLTKLPVLTLGLGLSHLSHPYSWDTGPRSQAWLPLVLCVWAVPAFHPMRHWLLLSACVPLLSVSICCIYHEAVLFSAGFALYPTAP